MSDIRIYTAANMPDSPLTGDVVICSEAFNSAPANSVHLATVGGASPTWKSFASDSEVGPAFSNQYSLDFSNPANSYLSFTSATFSATSGFTLSAWVNFSSLPSDQEMILGTVGNSQFWAFNPVNKYFYLKNSSGSQGYAGPWSGTPATNTWYHLMAVDTGTDVKAYINGDFVANYANLNSSLGGSATFDTIAKSGGRHMTGSIDEVAIWESDQTANISTIYNDGVPASLSDLNPAAWWRMGDDSNDNPVDGGSVASITDSSGNGHTATQATASVQPTFSTSVPS